MSADFHASVSQVSEVTTRQMIGAGRERREARARDAAPRIADTACAVATGAWRVGPRRQRGRSASTSSQVERAARRVGHRGDEQPGVRMRRPHQHRAALALLDDLAAEHHRDSRREPAHGREVVRDEQHRDARARAAARRNRSRDRGGGRDIERGERLVGDEHFRLHRERPRDRDALLLSARQIARPLGEQRSDRAAPARAALRHACAGSRCAIRSRARSAAPPGSSPMRCSGLRLASGSWNTIWMRRRSARCSCARRARQIARRAPARCRDVGVTMPAMHARQRRLSRSGLADQRQHFAGVAARASSRARRARRARPRRTSPTRRAAPEGGCVMRHAAAVRRCAARAPRRAVAACTHGVAHREPASALPCSTQRPRCITRIRSHMAAATARSCVMSSSALDPAPRLSSARICSCTVASSAVVGSSAISSAGSLRRARAIIARCR